MRENKRKLQFKKIKIANMNSLRGGGETDTVAVYTDTCSTNPGCPILTSDIQNPCSDACNNPTERPQYGNSGGKGECLGPCTQ
ncbi:hypothetical protein H2O64_13295 [Kordia sp. YSTF-M3]|uniref:Bacteriocin n=1 Tax=Kordia aestuariivivens TaxID=2759037 RepID=A0ABR7QAU0_9FLAO|nr:hypothetical protein [Kordia aestuariivivens]MBC8755647.1 hypothetical protein [Kordia aestuariivivens]